MNAARRQFAGTAWAVGSLLAAPALVAFASAAPPVLAADAPTPPAVAPATTTSAPTTRPDTRPATGPIASLHDPRSSLKWFAAALRDGDVPQLRRVVFTASDAEDHMIAAMGEMAQSLAKLHRAASAAFGPEQAGRFTDDTAAHFDQTVARIDAAEVVVEGEVATVRYAEDKDNPFSLRRVKEQWRIPASQFAGGAPPEVIERRANEMLIQARIVTDVAKDVAAGKYRNADGASLAWRSKMMSALGGGPTPAPAPPPATQKSP